MTDFKSTTVNGLFWSLFDQFGTQIVRVATFLLLAKWFLPPTSFGIVGMVTAITGYATVVIQFGFGQVLIYEDSPTQRDLSSVFWLNLLIGAVLTVLVFGMSGLVADVYSVHSLKSITRSLSLVYLLSSSTVVQRTLLSRHMSFKRLAIVDLIAALAAALVAVAIGTRGGEHWAIVGFNLANASCATALLWCFACRWIPSLEFSSAAIRRMAPFSIKLLLNQTLNYAARNADKLLIGRYLGSHMLGLYWPGYTLVLLPVTNVCNAVVRVLFPSFASIRNDLDRIRNVFLRISQLVFVVNGGAFVLLWIVLPDCIRVVGDEWKAATSCTRILCAVGIVMSLRTIQSGVYMSQGRNGLLLTLNSVGRLCMVCGFFVGVRYGIDGIALSYLATVSLSYSMLLVATCSLLDTSIWRYLRTLLTPFACLTITAVVTCMFRTFNESSATLLLLSTVVTFVAIYLALLCAAKVSSVTDALSILTTRILLVWCGK